MALRTAAFEGMELRSNFSRPRRSAPLSGLTSSLVSAPLTRSGESASIKVSSDGSNPLGTPAKQAGKPGTGVGEGVKVAVGAMVRLGVLVADGVCVAVAVQVGVTV